MSKQSQQDKFKGVAETKDIPEGKMKHLEVDGKELLIANAEGRGLCIV